MKTTMGWGVRLTALAILTAGLAGAVPEAGAADTALKSVFSKQKELVWLTDFATAKADSKETGLPILMDFTGSDWCGWCIRLDEEVFTQPEFVEYAEKNLILLKIDFPRAIEQTAEQKKANDALQEEYNVEGFPTIILVDAEGKEIATTGYQRGGAQLYVEHLQELLKDWKP